MRVHKAQGSFDLDKERMHQWYRPGKGIRRAGPVKQLSREELAEFARENGLELSSNSTFRVERHS
jgi:hypothetical protein